VVNSQKIDRFYAQGLRLESGAVYRGEAIASYHYGVELHPASHRVFDGGKNGKEIQIKATQNDSVDLKAAEGGTLLVFKISQNGSFEEVYNGNMNRVWQSLAHRKATKAGEVSISLKQLRALQAEVREGELITRENRQS
jgi:hypothetical protein